MAFSDDAGENASANTAKLSVRTNDSSKVEYKDLVSLSRPSDLDFARDTEMVANYADLRAERLPEIHVQRDDVLSFFGAVEYMHATRNRWTLYLLNMSLDVATAAAQSMKLALACPRPIVFAQQLQPLIQTPEHGTYPSGHATQAFTVATVLHELANGPDTPIAADSQIFRMAVRIAANRTVAGVHFPSDSAAGAVLGVALGRYLAARARGSGAAQGHAFSGPDYHDNGTTRDFHYAEFHKMLAGDNATTALTTVSPRAAPLLGWVWGKAIEEHAQRWR